MPEGSILDFSQLPDVAEEHPELKPEERWYAAHMVAREHAFTAIFGESEPPGAILSPADGDLQVNWPGGGVYQFPPGGKRAAWHYVTHGLAQPFSEEQATESAAQGEDAASGLGLELVVSAPQSAVWAPNLLLDLVRYLLFQEGARVFQPWERIPYSGFSSLGESRLTHLLAVISQEYPTEVRLPAGFCTLIHMVGVTDAEIEKARALGGGAEGSLVLARVLQELGIGWATTPDRDCATEHPLFDEVWEEQVGKVKQELGGEG
jgi:hypothetical protein